MSTEEPTPDTAAVLSAEQAAAVESALIGPVTRLDVGPDGELVLAAVVAAARRRGGEAVVVSRRGRAATLRRLTWTTADRGPGSEDPLRPGAPVAAVAAAELLARRAAGTEVPHLPAAAAWTVEDLPGLARALGAERRPEASPTADAVATLRAVADRLTSELGWRPLRTLGDAENAVALLERVETLSRTYIPLAFGSDMTRTRQVLDGRLGSVLSAAERDRRREAKRLGVLRHDGTFGSADVDVIAAVQRDWAERASSVPQEWFGRRELAQATAAVRVALEAADPQAPDTVLREQELDTAVTRGGEEVGEDQALAALRGVWSGEDPASFVRGVWLRALLDDHASVGTGPGTARRQTVDLPAPSSVVTELDPSASPPPGTTVVVLDAHARPATDLPATEAVVVLLGDGSAVTDGSVWAAAGSAPILRAAPPVLDRAGAAPLRDALAAQLRAAGIPVLVGTQTGRPDVGLLVPGEGGRDVVVDLDVWFAPADARARTAALAAADLARLEISALRWYLSPAAVVDDVNAGRRAEQERAEQERAEQERAERERVEQERVEQEHAEQEHAEQERVERERAEQERVEQERAEQERAEQERAEQERAEQERAEQERAEQERAEQERAERERVERERAEQERAEQERAEQERVERERAEQERAERERAEQERAERERSDRERAERERAEQERAEQERAEQERAEQERAEQERERVERERAEQERAERERADRERADRERADRERADRERAERERAEQERAERERAERERAERERADRERADRERAEQERAEQERAQEPGSGPAVAASPELPPGLGSTADAERVVAEFRDALGTAHPNIDQTPPAAVDAALALAYARLGVKAADPAVLEAAQDILGFRRRGVKVLRAFKESMLRSKKKMRGSGVKIT
ncbi:hypothetical protein [Kineococcus gynurae]|uniref:TolA protein n=1 Tax=Kineococcus gynurae TaxID=452979 RepID=A0ABV5LS25_9ACTN